MQSSIGESSGGGSIALSLRLRTNSPKLESRIFTSLGTFTRLRGLEGRVGASSMPRSSKNQDPKLLTRKACKILLASRAPPTGKSPASRKMGSPGTLTSYDLVISGEVTGDVNLLAFPLGSHPWLSCFFQFKFALLCCLTTLKNNIRLRFFSFLSVFMVLAFLLQIVVIPAF